MSAIEGRQLSFARPEYGAWALSFIKRKWGETWKLDTLVNIFPPH